MNQTFEILTGSFYDVQKELNDICENKTVIIKGMSATDNTTTIIIEIMD